MVQKTLKRKCSEWHILIEIYIERETETEEVPIYNTVMKYL